MSKTIQPLVSIVIPCFNQGQFLDDSIGSALTQSYSNYEIIVVDDGSTEPETVRIINEIKIVNVDIIRQKNKGLSEARNTGVKHAKGKYVVCLDADDILGKNYLKKAVPILESDKSGKLGFVTTWLREFGFRQCIWKPDMFNPGRLLVENIAHAGSMFRKTAWEKVGGYKKEMKGGYEDWEFWMSITEAGYLWKLIPEVHFLYRVREGSMLYEASSMHLDLYSRMIGFHTKLVTKYANELAHFSAEKIHYLRGVVAESAVEVSRATTELDRVNSELHMLHNSKVIAPAISLRIFLLKVKEVVRGGKNT